VRTADYFGSVGAWYDDFTQTTDEDVVGLLDRVWGG
jgi:predicted phosphoribosyltransferase